MKRSINYIPSFDGLRGISVVLVVISHASYGQINGWVGVDLFFILSGYLITSILQTEYHTFHKIDFINFYVRRVLRLAPALLLGILLANIVWTFFPSISGNRTIATVATLFYFNNFLDAQLPGLLSPLWSLSVEEHFYIVWPFFTALFLFQLKPKRQILIISTLIVCTSVFRILTYYHESDLTWGIFAIKPYRATFCRVDSILLGSILSFLNRGSTNITFNNISSTVLLTYSLALLIPLIIFVLPEGSWLNTGGFLFSNSLCLVIVFIALKNPNQLILAHPFLRWIGQRSYGIYVFHMPIVSSLEILRQPNDWSNLIIITLVRLLLTVIIAALSFKFIEKPILELKRKNRSNLVPTAPYINP